MFGGRERDVRPGRKRPLKYNTTPRKELETARKRGGKEKERGDRYAKISHEQPTKKRTVKFNI